MGDYTLTLLIYSGRENPAVKINKQEFDQLYELVKKASNNVNDKFLPHLGEIGFYYQAPGISIECYSSTGKLEQGNSIRLFAGNESMLKNGFEHFFSHYGGEDAFALTTIVKKQLFPESI